MIKKIHFFSLLFMSSILLASCTDSAEEETSALEEQQHQMVEEMVENINEPLDKANLAIEISEDYNRRIEEAAQEQ